MRPITLVVASAAVVSAAPAAAQITVGPNVQVSRARGEDPHYEFIAAADPTHPDHLLVCSMVSTAKRQVQSTLLPQNTVVYLSRDGGKRWQPTLQPDDSEGTSDPACTFGPDGTAYYVTLAEHGEMLVYRSTDAETWNAPLHLPFIDRPYITFDATGGRFHGRGYINGTGDLRALGRDQEVATTVSLFQSIDGFRTVGLPATRAAWPSHYVLGMGNSVVLSDGTLVTLFGEVKDLVDENGFPGGEIKESTPGVSNAWLKVIRSADGGKTLDAGATVSDWYLDAKRSQSGVAPMIAVDPGSSAFKDRLYAVWPDARSARLEVLLAHSDDNGLTWSAPLVVNDDRPRPDPMTQGPDATTPLVAVSKAGVVGVAWTDRRDHTDNRGWDKRFAASLDGGETFLPSIRVSSASNTYGEHDQWPVWTSLTGGGSTAIGRPPGPLINLQVALDLFLFSEGHTGGMAVDARGVFHPIWVDNRTGVPQLWTAPVSVKGAVVRNGSPALSVLDDVTQRVILEATSTTYDRPSNTATVVVRLKNTSADTIRGPLKARVLTLRSPIGVPAIVGADNGAPGPGAVWDLTSLLTDERLPPGGVSRTKPLRFTLSSLRPLPGGAAFKPLVDLNVRVLGQTAPNRSPDMTTGRDAAGASR